jgi:hypothetical protein
VKELENHVQMLVRESERVRTNAFLHKLAPELADERWSTRVRHETVDPRLSSPALALTASTFRKR